MAANSKAPVFAQLTFVREQFNELWQQREPRERQLLTALAVFLLAAFVYGVLLSPAIKGIGELKNTNPRVRQQLAEMAALQKKQTQLQGAISDGVPDVAKEQLEAALTRVGIKPQMLAMNGEVVRLQVTSAAYASLMDILLEWQRSNRLIVDEAKIQALPETGMVSATITLRQLRGGA